MLNDIVTVVTSVLFAECFRDRSCYGPFLVLQNVLLTVVKVIALQNVFLTVVLALFCRMFS